jgi:hypothetical protein
MLMGCQSHRLTELEGLSLRHPEDISLCTVIAYRLKNNLKLQDNFQKLAIKAGLTELTRRQFEDDDREPRLTMHQ